MRTNFRFRGAKATFGKGDATTYEVVATDYDNFAIINSCTNYLFGLVHYQGMWILSRKWDYDDTNERDFIADNVDSYSTERLMHTFQGTQCNYPF